MSAARRRAARGRRARACAPATWPARAASSRPASSVGAAAGLGAGTRVGELVVDVAHPATTSSAAAASWRVVRRDGSVRFTVVSRCECVSTGSPRKPRAEVARGARGKVRRYPAPTARPQVTQNFHSCSSSLPHAGQWRIVRSCPQCGQKLIGRPAGSSPLQCGHSSPPGATVIGRDGRRVAESRARTRSCRPAARARLRCRAPRRPARSVPSSPGRPSRARRAMSPPGSPCRLGAVAIVAASAGSARPQRAVRRHRAVAAPPVRAPRARRRIR